MNKKLLATITCAFFVMIASAQQADSIKQKHITDSLNAVKAKATELWSPEPPIVTPGATPQDAPSDAIILFNGANLDQWRSVNDTTRPADWTVANGAFIVNKKAGNIETKQRFMDYQLHLEWKEPENENFKGQEKGNSGVFLASTGPGDVGYEIQILNCYNNKTYVNGQTGSVYKQVIPLANACKKPGEWQTYDIIWTAPRFDAVGNLSTTARVTVIHNGIVLLNSFEPKGQTRYIGTAYYTPHAPSPIKLQSHGDPSEPISFRNIWVRELH